ncbi:MAG: NifB/NifX family molybdenum-iron cluster-binding protein [Eubacteriales bacterium]
MKIAIPEINGEVNQHFGRSKSFAIVEMDNNAQISAVNFVSTEGMEHNHEGIAEFLHNSGVEVVIAGGIGLGAIKGLESQGLRILFGAEGPVEPVVESFAAGEFVSERKVCGCHGDHKHHR